MTEQPAAARPTLVGLGGRLRELREATRPRLSQTAAGKPVGMTQNSLSRIENGERPINPGKVRDLAKLYGADRDTTRQLVQWAEALQPGTVDARQIIRRGGGTAAFQARVRQLEEGSQLVRAFQPGMVLGVVQTRAYASVVFRGDADAVDERLRRNRLLIDEPTRCWELVQPIGALLWTMGDAAVMAEQMDALIEVSRMPNVDLRIVTSGQPHQFALANGFHLYDDRSVLVGIKTGTTISENPADVALYADLFAKIRSTALARDDARGVLRQLAKHYRQPATGSDTLTVW